MKRKILIVDDEPLIIKSLEIFLRFSFDGEVRSSTAPKEALLIAEEFKPDMVISDFMMEEMNGLELLKKIKEFLPNSIFILLTGYADKENAIKCINEVGIYYYAEKPWDNTSLMKIIENGLEKATLQKELKKKLAELQSSNNQISRLYNLLRNDFDLEVDNLQNLLVTLANLIESKDKYTEGHTRRVSTICRLLGKELELGEEQVKNLEMAGFIHDIGKVGIPEAILNKPGKLTAEEFEEIKQHTTLGYHICKPLNILKDCLDPIRHHHEKLNGTGYPDGLKDDEISIETRILSVADIFDALYSSRSYRKKLDISEVKKILFEEADSGLIDKKIVLVLFDLYEKKKMEEVFSE